MTSDETLWKGFQAGDKLMYLALYKKYYHCLLFIGLKQVRDSDLVKDVIQQQFLYLWEKRNSIGDAKNVRSYIISSFLRRLTKDWIKAGKKSHLEIAWSGSQEKLTLTSEEILIAKNDREGLYKSLMDHVQSLPPRQKELIILRFYEGLNYDEIVQRTGLTHRTVYNKICETVKKMRIELEKGEFAIASIS